MSKKRTASEKGKRSAQPVWAEVKRSAKPYNGGGESDSSPKGRDTLRLDAEHNVATPKGTHPKLFISFNYEVISQNRELPRREMYLSKTITDRRKRSVILAVMSSHALFQALAETYQAVRHS